MASYTGNLNLKKPALDDDALITDINNNMDILDAAANGIQDALAIVANGNTHVAISAGQFVYVRNHSTLTEGLYVASSNIAANATLSTSNLTADSAGGLNALNSKITNKLVYKEVHVTPSDTTNYIYDTGVSNNDYFCVGAFTPFDDNIEVRMTNKSSGTGGNYRYTLWDAVTNTKITSGYNYYVYCAFLSRSNLTPIT